MATKLEDLVTGAVNVGFGAAALTVDTGKKVLKDLNDKGAEVRHDSATPDIARSVSDMFEQAGGTVSELTARLSNRGEGVAEKVLDELIGAYVGSMTASERTAFLAHVRDIVDAVEENVTTVPVETVEDADVEDAEDATEE